MDIVQSCVFYIKTSNLLVRLGGKTKRNQIYLVAFAYYFSFFNTLERQIITNLTLNRVIQSISSCLRFNLPCFKRIKTLFYIRFRVNP